MRGLGIDRHHGDHHGGHHGDEVEVLRRLRLDPSAARRRAAGAAIGIVVDRFVGEPPDRAHPVSLFGRAMQRVERGLYGDDRRRGMVHAGAGFAIGAAAGAAAGAAVRSTIGTTYVAVAGRALGDAATSIGAALDGGDLDEARRLLPSLVGRDPDALDAGELCRAVVESVAENTVDAIVAPALWGALGGSAAVLGYRAINTMDAMVGHHSDRYEHYGWAAARLDDAAAWVPARITALLVAAVRPRSAPAVWRIVRRDAPAHPSPNSGVAEAAFAAALGLQLGGTNRYGDRIDVRPPLGDGRPAGAADIAAAVRLSRDVSVALAAALAAPAVGRAARHARQRVGRANGGAGRTGWSGRSRS